MDIERRLISAMAEQCKNALEGARTPAADLPQPLHPRHLYWMCEEVVKCAETWPTAKLHRWLGFVQGGVLANRRLDLEGIKAMSAEARSALEAEDIDFDLADHLDPSNSFELDIGGQG